MDNLINKIIDFYLYSLGLAIFSYLILYAVYIKKFNFIISNLLMGVVLLSIVLLDIFTLLTLLFLVVCIIFGKFEPILLIYYGYTVINVITIFTLNFYFYINIIKEISTFYAKKFLLSFIIKVLTAITLLLTGINGLFDDINFLNVLITLFSFITLIFSFYEIANDYIELQRGHEKGRNSK